MQERFWKVVSANYGLSKDGPKRQRLSRKDYFKQKREIKLIKQAKEQAKTEGYKFAIDDFESKNWLNKIATSFTVKNSILQEAASRGDRYKKGLSNTKKKLLNTEKDLEETEKELTSLKDNFKARVNNQTEILRNKNSYLENINNNLNIENNKIKTENQKLLSENTSLKTENTEYKTFMDRVKKYFGDRFPEFLQKIKPKDRYTLK